MKESEDGKSQSRETTYCLTLTCVKECRGSQRRLLDVCLYVYKDVGISGTIVLHRFRVTIILIPSNLKYYFCYDFSNHSLLLLIINNILVTIRSLVPVLTLLRSL